MQIVSSVFVEVCQLSEIILENIYNRSVQSKTDISDFAALHCSCIQPPVFKGVVLILRSLLAFYVTACQHLHR